MARRKNTKRIDPRYFMDEKMERIDEMEEMGRESERIPHRSSMSGAQLALSIAVDVGDAAKAGAANHELQEIVYSHLYPNK